MNDNLFRMSQSWNSRTSLLFGEGALDALAESSVLVVGVGGVGAYAAEMICRAGVGKITIVDADCVSETNINRQLVALHSTVGERKVDVLGRRLLDINPKLELTKYCEFLKDERVEQLLDSDRFDYVIDAIDSLSPKVFLIKSALERKMPLISSMGAGAKSDITQIKIADISKSFNCNLAKAVRKRLSKLGIKKGFVCVFSTEIADEKAVLLIDNEQNKVSTTGTVSYMPATFGNYISYYVIRSLLLQNREQGEE